MMKSENVILAAGATQTLSVTGKWFRVRELTGGTDPYVSVKSLSVQGRQLADGLIARDGDLYGWEGQDFRDLTFHNPTATAVTFEVVVSDEGRHEVSRPAVAILGNVTVNRSTLVGSLDDSNIAAGATDNLESIISGVGAENLAEVIIQADKNNPNELRVGGSLVDDANGYVLEPGADVRFQITGTDTNLSVFAPTAGGACVYRVLILVSPTTL